MSAAKHTPGPWSLAGIPESLGIWAGGTIIATVSCSNRDGAGIILANEANARLIAAAPDMLEALRDCTTTLGRLAPDGTAYKLACAAYAKAGGS